MAAFRTENFLDAVEPGMEMVYRESKENAIAKAMRFILFPRATSKNKNYVKTSAVGGLGPLPEFTGEITELDQKQLYEKRNDFVEYAGMVKIVRALADDAEWGVMADKAEELAISGDMAMEISAHLPFNSAFTLEPATFGITGDGTEWCASDHPTPYNSTTQSNEGTDAMSAVSVEATRILMVQMSQASGQPALVQPDTLLYAENNWEVAEEISKSQGKVDTQLNNINVHRGKWRTILAPHRLTDTNNWFMLDYSRHQRKNKFYVRVEPEFNRDTEFTTLVKRFSSYGRWVVHIADWLCIYGMLVA